jgi:uncharacterized secreted protein with C-terminal beta-propeller domain
MKNDFDFIKEKIDNSGVNAPESMDEGYVLDRIAEIQPNPLPEPSLTLVKPKRNWKKIAAAAACFVIVAAIGGGITAGILGRKAVPPVSKSTGLVQFENYDQVRTALKEIDSRNRKYTDTKTIDYEAVALSADGAAPAANGSASGSSGSASGSKTASYGGSDAGTSSHSETYKQVEGVDEPDIIKTDGRFIYVTEHSYSGDYSMHACVAVFPAVPGTTDPIIRITPGGTDAATPDEADPDQDDGFEDLDSYTYSSSSVNDLFIKDSRLVIICSDYSEHSYHGMYSFESLTRAYVYDVADIGDVKLLDTFTQSGSYTSSRMIGDALYLITNDYSVSDIPICGRGAAPDSIAADCIYSIEEPSEETFLIVGAYDTLDHTAAAVSKAILGVADDIYCSESNLYIAATEWNYGPILYNDYAVVDAEESDDAVITYGEAATSENDEESVKTKIFKVSLSDGIAFTACGEVIGYTNNQYSFDEYNGNLRVATTSQNSSYEDVNNLYVLDGELNIIGSVTGFAPTESIKAVRYIGETAYVITYEQTDPLFIINLSEPTAPAVLGEVKISGFSTMLVPIDENTLLGIGVNTGEYDYTTMEVQDGVKLALFDVSDKSNPKVLDSRSYVNYNSAVTYNPRALVYNAERNDYLIPLSYYYYDDSDEYVWSEGDDDDAWEMWYQSRVEQYGGALNFTVKDGRLVETDLIRTESDTVDRAVYVGGTIYMTSYDENGEAQMVTADYR